MMMLFLLVFVLVVNPCLKYLLRTLYSIVSVLYQQQQQQQHSSNNNGNGNGKSIHNKLAMQAKSQVDRPRIVSVPASPYFVLAYDVRMKENPGMIFFLTIMLCNRSL